MRLQTRTCGDVSLWAGGLDAVVVAVVLASSGWVGKVALEEMG